MKNDDTGFVEPPCTLKSALLDTDTIEYIVEKTHSGSFIIKIYDKVKNCGRSITNLPSYEFAIDTVFSEYKAHLLCHKNNIIANTPDSTVITDHLLKELGAKLVYQDSENKAVSFQGVVIVRKYSEAFYTINDRRVKTMRGFKAAMNKSKD